jgi:hypothetical protein
MGRLFSDATPEEEDAFIEQRRQEAFLAACRWPLSWGIPAERHKRAADYLYEIAYAAGERESVREATREWKSGTRTLAGEELADYRDSELLQDYLLLSGYAMECILKGILLMMRPDLVVDDKRLHSLVLTHDLNRLCTECHISLSADEAQLLGLITRHVLWGKYAGPKDVEDMPSPVDPDDKRRQDLSVSNPFVKRRVQVLLNGVYTRASERFAARREEWRAQHAPGAGP